MVSIACHRAGPIDAEGRAGTDNAGVTLIELIIVVTVILILSAVAVPGYISWLPRYRLNSATDDLLSVLQQAKMRAIKENADVVVDFDPNGSGNPDGRFIVFVDNGNDGHRNGKFSRKFGSCALYKFSDGGYG